MPVSIQQVIGHLPNVAISYRNADGIARRLLNRVPVSLRGSTFTTFDKDSVFRRESGKMARLAKPKSISQGEGTDDYACKDWGMRTEVPFGIQSLTPYQLNRVNRAVQTLQGKLDMDLEGETADLVATFAHDAAPKAWSDPTSDPVKDIKALRRKLLMGSNTLVLGPNVFDTLQYHPMLKELRNVSEAGSVSRQQMAAIFEVKEILVPEMKGTTTPKGRADAYGYLWGNEVFLCYRAESDEITDVDATWAAIFELEGAELYASDAPKTTSVVYAGNERGRLVRLWEDPEIGNAGGSVIALGAAYDLKKIGADLGRGLSGVL